MDTTEYHEYHDQNANEVEALVEIGALDPSTARRVINVLRDRYCDFQDMSVTDRVDLARDLVATRTGRSVS